MSSNWFSQTALLSPQFALVSEAMWRVVLSAVVLIIGLVLSKRITQFFRRSLKSLLGRRLVKESPIGSIFESTQALKGSGVFTNLVFWALMLLFLSIAGEILGITLFTNFVALILGFIPMVLSAVIVLGFGIVVAGVAERVVKKQFKRLAPQQSVIAGTLASYFTLSLFSLIALSELGIASDFILVLFAGFVLATALSIGLAIGLGAKDLVRDSLTSMVNEEKQRRQQG